MKGKSILATLGMLVSIPIARAHCPLCTVGAAAAAGGAAYLGVDKAVIGIFLGAFAVSTGWWIARMIKKQFIPYQLPALVVFSFLSTILPVIPLLKDIHPWYVAIAGPYGSLLHSTYVIDWFVIGAIVGGAIVCITPWLSQRLTKLRKGKFIPYQGIILTFVLLLLSGIIVQFTI